MLTLLLLRHAKSSWDDPSIDDFKRPLADRGRRAAELIGRHIAERGLKPDLILCSAAVRTRQTLDLVLSHIASADAEIRYEDDLYLASATSLLARLKRAPDRVRCLMLVGHNPGLEDLARQLAGSGEPSALHALVAKFPTAALAVLTFEARRWSQLAGNTGKLASYTTPRSLKG